MLRTDTPYQRRRRAEDALRSREHTTSEIAALLEVNRRTAIRIINELSLFLPVQELPGNRYRIC
jgi:predicted DNA-binding transcriptional regulator YafY